MNMKVAVFILQFSFTQCVLLSQSDHLLFQHFYLYNIRLQDKLQEHPSSPIKSTGLHNGVLTLFKVEKKYYLLHTNLEHLRSEGWQFIGLSGRYSGFYTPNVVPSHTNQFLFFCHTVEKIKMKQVEEEYFKINDAVQTIPSKTTSSESDKAQLSSDGLVPPTPLNHVLKQLLTNMGQTVDGTSQQPEVSVRPSLLQAAPSKKSLLQSTPEEMSPKESIIRVGTEIPTAALGKGPSNSENT